MTFEHLREFDVSEPGLCAPELSKPGLKTVAYNVQSPMKKVL